MRQVDPKIYTKEYYLTSCLGYEEFSLYQGKKVHKRVQQLLKNVALKKGQRILDIGCGRGDIVFYCAQKGLNAVGIDYAKDAIILANKAKKTQKKSVQDHTTFLQQDAKNIDFPENSFDLVVSVDVFEHLYKEELEIVMGKIKKILKNDGMLLVHTEANPIFLDFTHPFYVYPMSTLLLWVNKLITKRDYPGIPKDPRNDLHKQQHVNEPTYFYLKSLFSKYQFVGEIKPVVGGLKPLISWKDRIYNIIVFFYPLCNFYPLHYFFAYDFVCIMKNKKDIPK